MESKWNRSDNRNEGEVDGATKTLSTALEDIARVITRDWDRVSLDRSVESILKREIALTLEHIENLRNFNHANLGRLLLIETYIDTEILQMEKSAQRYSWENLPEKEKLQRSLFELERERRNTWIKYGEKLESHHNRLLSLLHKHVQVKL